jgi:predicted dehydrogenase
VSDEARQHDRDGDRDRDEPVRIGLIGLGSIGRHHATQLGDVEATLVGGVDVDADARESFGEAYGIPTFDDAASMYAETDAEAVVVATPNRYHEEYAVDALAAGRHVLVEKPLAHDLASAERIAAAAADAPGICMVGFNNRFRRPAKVLRSRIEAGELGEVRHVEAAYVRRRGIPARGSWFTSKAVAGGGVVVDLGVHAVDLALHFMGHPEVVEVSASTRATFGGREDYVAFDTWGVDSGPEGVDVEDAASAFVRCADGRTISLETAWATNRPDSDVYHVRGTEAGARYERGAGELTIYGSGTGGDDHLSDTVVHTRDDEPHRDEQRAFVEAIRSGADEPPTNTVAEGLAAQRVLDAVYRSAAANRAVEV